MADTAEEPLIAPTAQTFQKSKVLLPTKSEHKGQSKYI